MYSLICFFPCSTVRIFVFALIDSRSCPAIWQLELRSWKNWCDQEVPDPCLRNVEQISWMWGKKLCKDPQKMRFVPTKVQFTRQANHAPICTQLFLNSWVPRIIMSDLAFSCSPRAIFCSIWSYQSMSISNKNYECQWVVGMDFQNLESHFWTSI